MAEDTTAPQRRRGRRTPTQIDNETMADADLANGELPAEDAAEPDPAGDASRVPGQPERQEGPPVP